jgi:hypothetical protein
MPGTPQDNAGFTNIQLRKIYLHAMPIAWQSTFEDADKTVADTSLNSHAYVQYFDKQHAKDRYKEQTEKANKNKKANLESQNSGKTSHNSCSRNFQGQGQGRGGRGRGQSQGQQGRIQNSGPRPFLG